MCAVLLTSSRYETGDPPLPAELVCGALHRMACEAMADAEALPIAAYEEDADPALLARDVSALTERAIQVVDLAMDHYESLPPSSLRGVELAALDGGLEGEVERRLERPAGVEKITSIAFVARLAMRARLQAIAALELPARRWELIAAAGGARYAGWMVGRRGMVRTGVWMLMITGLSLALSILIRTDSPLWWPVLVTCLYSFASVGAGVPLTNALMGQV